MPSLILDQWGKPARFISSMVSSGLYTERESRVNPPHAEMFGDFAQLLPRYAWKRALSDCRWIVAAFPLVNGASNQKADYASASKWHTYFGGEDQEWGDQAEAMLQQVDKICVARSSLFDWKSLWRCGIKAQDADGGFFIYLGQNEDGFPVLQPFEAHRIGSWDNQEGMVDAGGYNGARIMNGIIYDRSGREIAYRLLGNDYGDYQDISARDMIHVTGDPSYFSQGRPLPRIAPALRDLYSVLDTRESEQIAQNANSRLTFVEENETGRRNAGQDLTGTAPKRTAAGTDTEIVEKGFWRYLKNGGSLKAHESNRPSDQWSRFDDKITATALFGMGWRIEMFDLSKLTSGAVHGFADQINTTIAQTFESQVAVIKRVRGYMISKLVQRGDLPESAEWYKWEVQAPADFTPNPSRAMQADLDAVRGGAQSMTELHRRYGKRPIQVLREQAQYLKDRAAVASEFGVDENDLGRTDMPGDNAAGAQLDADGNPINAEAQNRMAEIEAAKATADAYGVAVRAGAITPTIEDEEFMRGQLGLVSTPAAARAAWDKDEGSRRPITLTQPGGDPPVSGFGRAMPSDPNTDGEALRRPSLPSQAQILDMSVRLPYSNKPRAERLKIIRDSRGEIESIQKTFET